MKSVATSLASVFFLQASVFANASEANVWLDRRQSAQTRAAQSATDRFDLALLSPAGAGLSPGVSERRLTLLNEHLVKATSAPSLLPDWAQLAVLPHARIQSISPGGATGKIVVLVQDIHLHEEAQLNIGQLTENLASEAFKRSSAKIIVGMEGASGDILDFSAYNQIPERRILKSVAAGLLKGQVINGLEYAAMAHQGASGQAPVTLPFELIGVESKRQFDENVAAIKSAFPMRERTQAALALLDQHLTATQQTHLSPALAGFVHNRKSHHDGKMGVADYVLSLASHRPITKPNLKLLEQASMLEKTLDWDRVESERTRFLNALAPTLSDAEMKTLLGLSALLKTGHLSLSGYLARLQTICAAKNISMASFPEFSLYVQYVAKSQSIESSRLFAELEEQEEEVETQLAKTDQEREIAALSRDLNLLKKLSRHEMSEDEWAQFLARRETVLNAPQRVAVLAGISAEQTSVDWTAFEDFYRTATERNQTMARKMADKLQKSSAPMGILVAGGFHTQGVQRELQKRGLAVVTVVPKLTEVGAGLSSVDYLASNQLPIDKLFAGQRLFIPIPPSSTGDAGSARASTLLSLISTMTGLMSKLLAQGSGLVTGSVHSMRISMGFGLPAKTMQLDHPDGGEPIDVDIKTGFAGAFLGSPASVLEMAMAKAKQSWPHRAFLIEGLSILIKKQLEPKSRISISNLVPAAPRQSPVGLRSFFRELGARAEQARRMSNVTFALRTLATQSLVPGAVPEKPLRDLVSAVMTFDRMGVERLLKATGATSPVDNAAAKEFEDLLSQLLPQLNVPKDSVLVRVQQGDVGGFLGEMRKPAAYEPYFLIFSLEFINSRVAPQESIDKILSAASSLEPAKRAAFATPALVRRYLIQRFMAHELMESVYRASSVTPEAVHKILVDNNWGAVLPEGPALSAMLALRLPELAGSVVAKHPNLFKPEAQRLPKPVAAPVAATPRVVAPVTAVQPVTAPLEFSETVIRAGKNGLTAVSKDGKALFAANKAELLVLDVESKTQIGRVALSDFDPLRLVASDNLLLVTWPSGAVDVIDISNPRAPQRKKGLIHRLAIEIVDGKMVSEKITSLAFVGRDGKEVLIATDRHRISLWDTDSGGIFETGDKLSGNARAIGFNAAKNEILIYGAGRIGVHDAASNNFKYAAHVNRDPATPTAVAAFNRKGDVLAVVYRDSTIRLINTADGKEIRRMATSGGDIEALAFNDDGTRLALAERRQNAAAPTERLQAYTIDLRTDKPAAEFAGVKMGDFVEVPRKNPATGEGPDMKIQFRGTQNASVLVASIGDTSWVFRLRSPSSPALPGTRGTLATVIAAGLLALSALPSHAAESLTNSGFVSDAAAEAAAFSTSGLITGLLIFLGVVAAIGIVWAIRYARHRADLVTQTERRTRVATAQRPTSPGESIVQENVNKIFSEDFKSIAGRESIGENAGRGYLAVDGIADAEGRVIAFGNIQELPAGSREAIVAGKVFRFTIRTKAPSAEKDAPDFVLFADRPLPVEVALTLGKTVQAANKRKMETRGIKTVVTIGLFLLTGLSVSAADHQAATDVMTSNFAFLSADTFGGLLSYFPALAVLAAVLLGLFLLVSLRHHARDRQAVKELLPVQKMLNTHFGHQEVRLVHYQGIEFDVRQTNERQAIRSIAASLRRAGDLDAVMKQQLSRITAAANDDANRWSLIKEGDNLTDSLDLDKSAVPVIDQLSFGSDLYPLAARLYELKRHARDPNKRIRMAALITRETFERHLSQSRMHDFMIADLKGAVAKGELVFLPSSDLEQALMRNADATEALRAILSNPLFETEKPQNLFIVSQRALTLSQLPEFAEIIISLIQAFPVTVDRIEDGIQMTLYAQKMA